MDCKLYGKYEDFSEYTVSSEGYIIGKKGTPLSTAKKCTGGYVQVGLYDKSHKRKFLRIHRLMGYVFLKGDMTDDEFDKLVINHKNGNKEDNNILNLELVTEEENRMHATETGLTHGRKVSNTKVYCYNNKTIYLSKSEACRELNINERSLSSHLNNSRTHVDGYVFIEASDESVLEELHSKARILYEKFWTSKTRIMPKECVDTMTGIKYLHFSEAEKHTSICRKIISKMCNSLDDSERFRFA